MTFGGDPYRTLGLAPGAPLDDVKRAYRRLAKQYHPDAAGQAATARFLAIQAAYESIVDDRGRGRRSARSDPTRPSQADPARARATREAYRARTGRAGSPGSGGRPWGGQDPAGGWWRDGRPGSGGAAASGPSSRGPAPDGTTSDAGSGRGARPGPGPDDSRGPDDGPGPATGRRSGGTAGPGGPVGPGGRGGAGRAGGPGRSSSRRTGSRRKATLSSTSYDDAVQESRHPDWDGGSWYGTSSGTYWTLNPREYADPRKHGPEYQARARRASSIRPPDRDGVVRPSPEPAGPADPAEAREPAEPAEAHGPWTAEEPPRAGTGMERPASGSAAPGWIGPRPRRGTGPADGPPRADPVASAASVGLAAGALTLIPASIVFLGSSMSGDVGLAALAVAVPPAVGALVGLLVAVLARSRG